MVMSKVLTDTFLNSIVWSVESEQGLSASSSRSVFHCLDCQCISLSTLHFKEFADLIVDVSCDRVTCGCLRNDAGWVICCYQRSPYRTRTREAALRVSFA